MWKGRKDAEDVTVQCKQGYLISLLEKHVNQIHIQNCGMRFRDATQGTIRKKREPKERKWGTAPQPTGEKKKDYTQYIVHQSA